MKFSEPKENSKSDSDPCLLQNRCGKFNPFYKNNADNKRAVVYMKLLKEGCPRVKAMHFTSKSICKTDSTKKKDGPNDFRILNILSYFSTEENIWHIE